MFCRTVWLFIILSSCVNIAKSFHPLKNSDIQSKFHSLQNEKAYKLIPTFKNGKTRTKLKIVRRAVTVIVNEDFDIPPDISNNENDSEISVTDEYEGSGTDEFNEKEKAKTTAAKFNSEYLKRTDTSTVLAATTKVVESQNITEDEKNFSIDTESSGDGTLLLSTTDYSATESEVRPDNIVPEKIPDICLNSTCLTNDLLVIVSDKHSDIAEGANFTFSCKSNYSNHVLYWYKTNGSVYFLQAFGTEQELHLNIPETKPIHSGKYMCIKWIDRQTCCNLQSDLSVYELPLYTYHLIIIGSIAVACLVICILLSVRQVMSLKSYTKEFVEKHGSVKKQQLL